MLMWNPWHGCRKCSEGCLNCYMFYLDHMHGQDGSRIYRSKTNFNLPLHRDRTGNFKLKSGSMVCVCMTSDFFLQEADIWRNEAWQIMRQRPDLQFWLLTKRADRIRQCLPDDRNYGWKHVTFNVTVENQHRADERIPFLLRLPASHLGLVAAPLLGPLELRPYLASGRIESVAADGENYAGSRSLDYAWVLSLYEQCRAYSTAFKFCGTGNFLIKDGRVMQIPRYLHRQLAAQSGLQYVPGDM